MGTAVAVSCVRTERFSHPIYPVAWLRWLPTAFALWFGLVWSSARADEARADERPTTEVRLLSARGVLDPVTARYLEREIGRAEADRADLVIIELDTAGGLDSPMRTVVQTLLGAHVPVVVYVAPSGARAASAGMFVTLAASVAAMAPGTAIGAAHPVVIGGGNVDPTIEAKVVNDAAAFARAIAEIRHRNASLTERAVRESTSLTSDEARREGVIDLVAATVPELLRQLDGRSVETASGVRTLHTTSTRIDAHPMLVSERLVRIASDPNVAYLLFLFGLLGIAAELSHPGGGIFGAVGAIALVLALVAFGNLPISWAGILLILVAVGLFVAELHTGTGALAVAALVSLVVGSLLLYRPLGSVAPIPDFQVNLGIVIAMSLLAAAFFLVVVRALLRSRHLAVKTGAPVLVGREGVATSELAPTGTVRVDSEVWSAEAESGTIRAGERVMVVGVTGVTLRVARSQQGEAAWIHSSPISS